MAKRTGKEQYLTFGTVNLTNSLSSEITWSVSADEIDASTINPTGTKSYLQGPYESTFDVTGVWDDSTVTPGVNSTFERAITGQSGTLPWTYGPAGSVAGRPSFSGQGFLTSREIAGAIDGMVGFSLTIRTAGSVAYSAFGSAAPEPTALRRIIGDTLGLTESALRVSGTVLRRVIGESLGLTEGTFSTVAVPGTYLTVPFNSNSIWNRPIPADATVDPNSAARVALMSTVLPFITPGATELWSHPIYYATSETPRYDVPYTNPAESVYNVYDIPIGTAYYADPADTGGGEFDGNIIIVDQRGSGDIAWAFWRFINDTENNGTASTSSSGYADLGTVGDGIVNYLGGQWGGRATGWNKIAGLIHPEEITQGTIQHALVMSVPGQFVAGTGIWPSAAGVDGYNDDPDNGQHAPYPLREGDLIQLNPSINIGTVGNLTPAGTIIARALQTYGAWIGDIGSWSAIYFREYLQLSGGTAALDTAPWAGLVEGNDLDGITSSMLRVIHTHEADYYQQSARLDQPYFMRLLSYGPRAYWQMGEASGTVVTDSTSRGRTGVYSNVTLLNPSANLLANANFETAGTGGNQFANWTDTLDGGTIQRTSTAAYVHGGTTALRILASPTTQNRPRTWSDQFRVVPGATYEFAFWTRGDGTNSMQSLTYDPVNATQVGHYTQPCGVTGTAYAQYTEDVEIPGGCTALLIGYYAPNVQDDTVFACVDDATFTVSGNFGIGDGNNSAHFQGAGMNSEADVFGTALAAEFDGNEGTFAAWVRLGATFAWQDTTHRVCYMGVDANNAIGIRNSGTADGEIRFVWIGGGSTLTTTATGLVAGQWYHLAMTWSQDNDAFDCYVNGTAVGASQTMPATWAGTITSATIGSGSDGESCWYGQIAHAAVFSRPLGTAAIAELARAT